MERNLESVLDKINASSLIISSCTQSLNFILKDLEEAEIQACENSSIDYRGLANIVEQINHRINQENGIIMNLSDSVYLRRIHSAENESLNEK